MGLIFLLETNLSVLQSPPQGHIQQLGCISKSACSAVAHSRCLVKEMPSSVHRLPHQGWPQSGLVSG